MSLHFRQFHLYAVAGAENLHRNNTEENSRLGKNTGILPVKIREHQQR